ncbi:CinA family nicotinamide mononucleotide deamidase-related protein [Ferrimonas lipolytica]|uniref:CinA-like protein n=1 Tax=Ferrimonas lipolytica TaxID=2724191 RepID=A0A6H1UHA9_9GAMM|nr:CinA family nicotinamide mononucleotide deamidase-related protein [Ferrimonas lipolytica]QIZ78495.1 CinA family nicotinamide mononucleotide deamidase-related protein [Ferrimonas lipolytica]
MHIEMICTGEEVLSGQIVDTNAAWVAQRLLDTGLEFHSRITVGDRMDDLVAAFSNRAGRADVVLVNGGLGPTIDDLSSEAMAIAMGAELVLHQGWLKTMTDWFEKNGRVMPDSNIKQAMLPAGAVMIDNPVGTACGFRVLWQGTWFVFTPGVPSELKKMVDDEILPWLVRDFSITSPSQLYRLLTTGRGESALAEQLGQVALPDGVDLGYRASLPYIEIKLMRRGEISEERWLKLIDDIRVALGDSWLGDNVYNVAEACHQLLLEQGKTVVTAESCTGGMVASNLVDIAGSSAYLLGGWVTYSNQAKQQELGVGANTLAEYGAVSMQVAVEMAQGALQKLDSDIAISITGIAGPDGGTEDKPVGTVAFALAHRGGYVAQILRVGTKRHGRDGIRKLSATVALDMIRRHLRDEPLLADYGFFKRIDSNQG